MNGASLLSGNVFNLERFRSPHPVAHRGGRIDDHARAGGRAVLALGDPRAGRMRDGIVHVEEVEPVAQHDPAFAPPEKPGKDAVPIGRQNFVELCHVLTAEDDSRLLMAQIAISIENATLYAQQERQNRAIEAAEQAIANPLLDGR